MAVFIDNNKTLYYCDTPEDLETVQLGSQDVGAEFYVLSTGDAFIVNSRLELVQLKKNDNGEVVKLAEKVSEIEEKGISDEKIGESIDNYLQENPIGIIDSKEISHESDGSLQIKEVSTEKMVQPDGSTLILFGGNAD